MSIRTLYFYNTETGEYQYSFIQKEDPIEPGVFHDVIGATELPPLGNLPNTIQTFSNGRWSLTPDYRGQIWYDANGKPTEIINLGIPPIGLMPSPSPDAVLKANKQSKIQSFASLCANQIMVGFTSSALGISNLYPCSTTDQNNINHAAILGGPLWSSDINNAWSFKIHTVDQAKQVQMDMINFIQSIQQKYADLCSITNGAKTLDAVATINW
jgi:hypothetical protein